MVGGLLGPKKTYTYFMEQGALAFDNEQYSESEREYARALEMAEEAKAHTQIAQCSLRLAVICERLDKLALAEPHYRRAYTTHEESEEFDEAAQALVMLGALYYKQRRFPDAEQVLQYALAMYQQQFGTHYAGIAEAATTLANCVMGRQGYAEAEKLLIRAISIDETAKGDFHTTLANEVHKLAVCFDKQNKDSDAVYNFKRATEIYSKNEADFSRRIAHQACECHHDFARHYLKVGKNTEAQSMFKRAMELAEKHPGYLDEADLAEKTGAVKA